MRKSVVVTEQKAVWGVVKGRDTLTASDLASDLDCSPQIANYWLTKFVRLGYLEKVRIGREFGYAVNARGKVLQGDINTPVGFRPSVTISCDHDAVSICGGNIQERHYICDDCGKRFDNITDVPKSSIIY